jgi:hypothetical protein
MRSLFVLVFICAVVFTAKAQQTHFVYLQTDNKQPFYVKLNEKLYSSSASGYLVIPKLENGTHNLSVGFPKNEWPAQVIPVAVANLDLGFMLKNFDSKGWGLFNMQTMDVTMASAAGKPSETAHAATRTDEFSNTLADVVNTPSIRDVKKEEVKEKEAAKIPEPAKPAAEVKSTETTNNTVATPVAESPNTTGTVNKVPSMATPPAGDTTILNSVSKLSELNTADGLVMKYSVQGDSGSDTVQVIILREEAAVVKEEPKKTAEATPPAETKAAGANEPKFINIELANPNTGIDTTKPAAPKVEEKGNGKAEVVASEAEPVLKTAPKGGAPMLKMINSDCKSSATEEDFLKVRKKMIAQKDENEMISAAQKLFRQKCYSSEQVKNLSVLFLKDDSKYKFFDAAYPFVHDTDNFKSLEAQLTDPYFISRFKAMIRN